MDSGGMNNGASNLVNNMSKLIENINEMMSLGRLKVRFVSSITWDKTGPLNPQRFQPLWKHLKWKVSRFVLISKVKTVTLKWRKQADTISINKVTRTSTICNKIYQHHVLPYKIHTEEYINFVVLPKIHNHYLIMKKASETLKLRDSIWNNWPVLFQNVSHER